MALPLALDIALRHLLHRRRQTLVSLLGVTLGVAFFIAISAMLQGFQRDFISRIIDIQPHIIVMDDVRQPPRQPVERAYPDGAVLLHSLKPREETRGLRGARNMLATLEETPGLHVAPALSGNGLIHFGGKDISVNIIGITPDQERKVTHIEKDLLSGTLDSLYTTSNAIILGEGVAKKAGIRKDDLINVVSPAGVMMKMKVVALFSSGITVLDNFDTYVLLKKAQVLQNRPNVINRLKIRLDDVEQAGPLAGRIERQFGYRAEPWQEQSRNVLSIYVIQNAIMYPTVSAILIVACFGIFNVISTVVFEKTRDIGIMKSMGFRDSDVRLVFVMEGLIVGVVGTLIGWLIGWMLIEFMASLKFEMEGFVKAQGFVLFRSPRHYLISGGMAVLSAALAAWLPARRASRLNPVDIVRGAG
ncbi:ABC transporter permease [Magnetospirillum fulvum]|uniref:Lipoprotein-releasing system permease protein n=1 Tax=Magnetospirillum fulvum TaxID=1082 RepID=A0A1H6HE96_MAGFU|nr:ABC transporter permease [Magnetospirillum fulvum]SEH32420.1 lipoprotein-releasing system permease protein [Magnetospirillum fulvum]